MRRSSAEWQPPFLPLGRLKKKRKKKMDVSFSFRKLTLSIIPSAAILLSRLFSLSLSLFFPFSHSALPPISSSTLAQAPLSVVVDVARLSHAGLRSASALTWDTTGFRVMLFIAAFPSDAGVPGLFFTWLSQLSFFFSTVSGHSLQD